MEGGPRDLLRAAARRFGKGLVLAAVLSMFVDLAQLVVPLFTMQVCDRVINSRSLETLAMLVVITLGALIVMAILDYIRARIYLVMGESIARRLNLPTLQASVAETLHGESSLATQASRDLNDLRSFITGNAISVPLEAFWVPLFLAVLFLLHPAYAVLAAISSVVLVMLSITTNALTRRPLAEASAAAAASFGEIGAAVRNAEVIEAMGMLPAVARRWRRAQYRMLRLLDRGSSAGRALAAISRATRLAMQVGVMSIGVIVVMNREASPGSMMAASILMARVLHPFEQLIEGWRQWVFAFSAYARVRDLLMRHHDRRRTMVLPRPEGRLVVDRLVYIPKGRDQAVLKGLSFALEPGEVLGVIGPSAAGKSTLARLLVGVWEPTAGGVYLDGHSVYLWEREDFGRHVGYLPQSVSLLEGTVRENIARMTEADPFAVVRAARRADVHEMIGRLPFGYETPIGDTGYGLSGGQRQRIALARALFGDPRLLVLDEPNANLDAEGEQALLRSIAEARRSGTTVVLIAHRPSIMAAADKLLVLKDGQIDQFGECAEILKSVTRPMPAAVPAAGDGRPGRPAASAAAGIAKVSRLVPPGER